MQNHTLVWKLKLTGTDITFILRTLLVNALYHLFHEFKVQSTSKIQEFFPILITICYPFHENLYLFYYIGLLLNSIY
jgi:hypothetical protein